MSIAPAPSPATVRPGPMGRSGPPDCGTSTKATSKLAVACPPRFRSVYITLTFAPGAIAVTVDAAVAVRSGPSTIGAAEAPTLFAVAPSTKAAASLARTRTK